MSVIRVSGSRNFSKNSSALRNRNFSAISLISLVQLIGSAWKLYQRCIFGQGIPPWKSSGSGHVIRTRTTLVVLYVVWLTWWSVELQDGVDIELLQNIELDRGDDDVYSGTTTVISTVMNMTQTATDKNVHLYVPLVKVRTAAFRRFVPKAFRTLGVSYPRRFVLHAFRTPGVSYPANDDHKRPRCWFVVYDHTRVMDSIVLEKNNKSTCRPTSCS